MKEIDEFVRIWKQMKLEAHWWSPEIKEGVEKVLVSLENFNERQKLRSY